MPRVTRMSLGHFLILRPRVLFAASTILAPSPIRIPRLASPLDLIELDGDVLFDLRGRLHGRDRRWRWDGRPGPIPFVCDDGLPDALLGLEVLPQLAPRRRSTIRTLHTLRGLVRDLQDRLETIDPDARVAVSAYSGSEEDVGGRLGPRLASATGLLRVDDTALLVKCGASEEAVSAWAWDRLVGFGGSAWRTTSPAKSV